MTTNEAFIETMIEQALARAGDTGTSKSELRTLCTVVFKEGCKALDRGEGMYTVQENEAEYTKVYKEWLKERRNV